MYHVRRIVVIRVFTIRRSDAFLSDYLIDSVKNCSQWGLNPQPPNHQFNALPTEMARNLLGLYKSLNDSHPQTNSELAQLVDHDSEDPEAVGSNPTGSNC